MSSLKGFELAELPLAGCGDRDPNCGLTAQDVKVDIGEQESNLWAGPDDPYKTNCRALIGSLVCAQCSLGSYDGVRKLKVDFSVDQTAQEYFQTPHIRKVRQGLQAAASEALPCVRQEDLDGAPVRFTPLRVVRKNI